MKKMLPGLCVILAAWPSVAQTPRPAFEVASVKKLDRSASLAPARTRGTVFSMPNATVASLIQFASEVRPFELFGGPDWVRGDRFAVEARASEDAPVERTRLMVQSLLDDRFGLVVRRETREMRYLALVAASAEGRPGPALKPCADPNAKAVPPPRPPPEATVLAGRCSELSFTAGFLAGLLEIPVVDRSGLSGKWDYQMIFINPRIRASAAADLTTIPALETALPEQLGLKLESMRGPMPVLVIESVRPPTED